jgi:hypothetical protein
VEREAVTDLVGRKVAVRLNTAEATGVEIVATLAEVRDDGVVLSEVGELGSGPLMVCPWGSLRRVRERPPWLTLPGEVPAEYSEDTEVYQAEEVPEDPEPPPLDLYAKRREALAENLQRVVPIAQRKMVDGITVALVCLEFFGEGLGVLSYRVSVTMGGGNRSFYGVPEPELVLLTPSGDELPWSCMGGGGSDSEADGKVEVRDLPEAGRLEAGVERLVVREWDPEAREEVPEDDTYEGPWTFHLTI